MATNVGRKNHLVRLERPAESTDSVYKSNTKSFVPVAQVWAEVRDELPTRAELQRLGVNLSRNASFVTIWDRADITSAWRIVELSHRRRILSIVGGPALSIDSKEITFACESK